MANIVNLIKSLLKKLRRKESSSFRFLLVLDKMVEVRIACSTVTLF